MLRLCCGHDKRKEKYKDLKNDELKIAYVYEPSPELQIQFAINGQKHIASRDITADTSLNTYIRQHAKLPGTKYMCLEAGCGACVVSLRGVHPVSKDVTTWAINSCTFPVFSCHGLEVITIEGIGNKKDGYHDLQKRLAKFNGTQCGFCSPGMVMNMYSLMEGKKGAVSMDEVENSFSGNICRCTGYRPILDAFKSVAVDAAQELKDVCDIEDFTGCLKACNRTCSLRVPVKLNTGDKVWYKPGSVTEILDIFKTFNANTKYMLVHGNTAHGIYRRDIQMHVFIDVTTVNELHEVMYGQQLVLGANLSLNDTITVLSKAADQSPAFGYCKELVKHLDLVANVPVRNVASLAGNLSIKHQHNEFPSDIFLLLETVGATLEILNTSGRKQMVKPKEFLALEMNRKVMTKINLPPLDSFVMRSFKVMPRAQNAHAYVNAGFLLRVEGPKENQKITEATVVFGGISPTYIHASQTEAFLIGKRINNDMLRTAISKLIIEIDPDWNLPDASSKYRKQLAISLFYKFILGIAPEVKSTFQSGGSLIERPLSSGQQEFDSNTNEWPLNQNVPKIEGELQCSGEAQYVNDIPPHPFELCAAFVVATEIGSTIESFDVDEAMALPGVTHFFSAKDIPGVNSFMPAGMLDVEEDEEIFCAGSVKFHGQPVGMILADSMETANRAASMVKIQYRSSTQKICVTAQSVSCSSEATERVITKVRKEPPPNIKQSHKIHGRFEAGGQYHFSMETQACIVIPGDQGLDVYASTQWMDLTHTAISNALRVPKNAINMSVKRLGGAFGSKLSRCSQIACAGALGAHLTNRPVRFVMTIESTMESVGKRYGFMSDYEVDVDDNGRIRKLMNTFSQDFGCSRNENVLEGTVGALSNCYDTNVMGHEGKMMITDAPSNTWCRAPGDLEGVAMTENIMEHIARELKLDPIGVRLQNVSQSSPLREILNDFIKSVEYRERQANISSFNAGNRWKKKGIACVPMKYPFEYYGNFHALASIYQGDGTVAITHGGIECGQGINTKAAQVAAYTLKIPLDDIKVKPSNTLTAPNNAESGTSYTSESVCYAVVEACKMLQERLKPYLKKMNNNWKDAVFAAYQANVNLAAHFMYKEGDAKNYDIWGVAAAEVEVDILTGNYIFHRVDIWEDVGESISPGIDVGQLEGAFVMGMGYWLTEQLIFDNQNGKLLTNRTWNYHVPMAKDIPVDFRVKFLKNRPNPFGVLRSKAIGEPPICMAVVCLFALRNALNDARKDAGLSEDYFQIDVPATPEHVFLASGVDVNEFVLN